MQGLHVKQRRTKIKTLKESFKVMKDGGVGKGEE